MNASLPAFARLPINRCNLPAVILGSLTFQRHPAALEIDGVATLHAHLFDELDRIDAAGPRAGNFMDYMRSAFLLDDPDEAGYGPDQQRYRRDKADYLRLLRGWFFNADGLEAAVLKGWVESRFGLLPRNHQGPLRGQQASDYDRFQHQRALGLYNSNALEAQLDLLYSYCQYELARQRREQQHVVLYRGTNRIDDYELLAQPDRHRAVLLLNNLNSFTSERDRADEFGDHIIEARVPLAKLLYFPGLLGSMLSGEKEHLVIGGIYQVLIDNF